MHLQRCGRLKGGAYRRVCVPCVMGVCGLRGCQEDEQDHGSAAQACLGAHAHVHRKFSNETPQDIGRGSYFNPAFPLFPIKGMPNRCKIIVDTG